MHPSVHWETILSLGTRALKSRLGEAPLQRTIVAGSDVLGKMPAFPGRLPSPGAGLVPLSGPDTPNMQFLENIAAVFFLENQELKNYSYGLQCKCKLIFHSEVVEIFFDLYSN